MIGQEMQAELQHNFNAFLAELPRLLQTHKGKFALIRHGRFEGYFDSPRAALNAGRTRYGDEVFSVQEVTGAKADLGWYSRAPGNLPL